jgi:hypothetical protein
VQLLCENASHCEYSLAYRPRHGLACRVHPAQVPLPDPDPAISAIDPHRQRHIQQAHHPELVTSLAPLATGRLSIHYSRSSARNPPSRPRSLLRPCSNTPIALRGPRLRCHPRTPATGASHTLPRGLAWKFSRRSARLALYGCYLASTKSVYRRVASCGFAGKLLGLLRTPVHARPERASLHSLISTTQIKLLSIIESCTSLPSLRPNHKHGLSIVPRVNELPRLEPEGGRCACQYCGTFSDGQSFQPVWCRRLC